MKEGNPFSTPDSFSRCPLFNVSSSSSSSSVWKWFFLFGESCLELDCSFYPGLVRPLKVFVRSSSPSVVRSLLSRVFQRMQEELNGTRCVGENEVEVRWWNEKKKEEEEGFFVVIDFFVLALGRAEYELILPSSVEEKFRHRLRSPIDLTFLLRQQNPAEQSVNLSLLFLLSLCFS